MWFAVIFAWSVNILRASEFVAALSEDVYYYWILRKKSPLDRSAYKFIRILERQVLPQIAPDIWKQLDLNLTWVQKYLRQLTGTELVQLFSLTLQKPEDAHRFLDTIVAFFETQDTVWQNSWIHFPASREEEEAEALYQSLMDTTQPVFFSGRFRQQVQAWAFQEFVRTKKIVD